jgi:hypothetical protein
MHEQIRFNDPNEGYVFKTWLGFCQACVPADVSEEFAKSLRIAFYAGALNLFRLMAATMESQARSGFKPSPADLARLAAMNEELKQFSAELEIGATYGNA